jgi:hypothetical protein
VIAEFELQVAFHSDDRGPGVQVAHGQLAGREAKSSAACRTKAGLTD